MAPQQYHDNPNVNVHEFSDDEYTYDDEPPRNGPTANNNASARNGGLNQSYNQSLNRIHPLQNGAAAESHKLPVDFDAFSSDAEKLSAILKCADVEGHKHALAVDYFRFRKYLFLIPIVLMSLLIAVMGFVAASNLMDEDMRVHDSSMQEFLIILVATCGFLVLLLTLLSNGLDYSSAVRFHRAAAEDLTGLCDRVRLYRMERAMDERAKEEDEELKDLFPEGDDASTSDESSDEEDVPDENAIIPHAGNAVQVKRQLKKDKKRQKRTERLTKTLVRQKVRQAREEQELSKDVITFYGYHTQLHQITVGCRSDVPPAISKFFQVMESRVELMSLSRLGVEEESRMRKNQIVRLCANEIYNEVSNHILWPLMTPNVDRTIEGALKRVGQLLNMNYRARRRCKVIPCCPIPLCCKKARTDNVFAIINEGIDQRELDMMQAERTELVRMEKERRAKMMAGPEEVLEMKDTMYSDTGNRDPGGMRSSSHLHNHFAREETRSQRSRRSRASQDPDGHSINDIVTEASYSFAGSRGGGSAAGGGGYADHYNYARPALGRYPDEEELMTEDEETYQDGSYVSYDEEAGESLRDGGEKKKKKKKKKSKKKKKKKEKSKKKEKKEEEEYTDGEYTEYSEEEEGDFTDEDYTEYSEEE